MVKNTFCENRVEHTLNMGEKGSRLSCSENVTGYYLGCFGIDDCSVQTSGIARKVKNQVECFNNSGLACTYIHCKLPDSKIIRGLGSLPIMPDGISWPKPNEIRNASFLYIRRPLFSTREFLNLLREFKHQNPSSKVVIEIPTYPYDQELQTPELFFAYRKEKKYRNRWRFYVDRIADLSEHSEIFGIPTIPFVNGIDIENISSRIPSSSSHETINIVYSAFFEFWHGCDLLIKGISDYYRHGGARNIVLHLVGGGSELPHLKDLARKLAIEEHIRFYGVLSRDEINPVYDLCTLAVGSLGLHRRNGSLLDSSIKTREYLAKGIPFFFSGDVDVVRDRGLDFVLQLPSGEHHIDMNEVISFHDALYKRYGEHELVRVIREFAEEHVSMRAGMSRVISYLKSPSS